MAAAGMAPYDMLNVALRQNATGPGVGTYENPWQLFFGMPTKNVPVDPFNMTDRTTWVLPDAYKGKSKFLGVLFDRRILSDNDWTTARVMPAKLTNDLSFTYQRIIMEPTIPEIVPELGIVRNVSARVEEGHAALVRRGQGIVIEHGFMLTEFGRKLYIQQLQLLLNNFTEAIQLSVIAAMQNAHLELLQKERYFAARLEFGSFDAVAIARREKEFAFVLNTRKFALSIMATKAVEEMKTRRIVPDTVIVPPDVPQGLLMKSEQVEYDKAGPVGPKRIAQGPSVYDTVQGMVIHRARLFAVEGSDMTNPMHMYYTFASHFYGGDNRSVSDSFKGYRTSERTIRIMDFEIDEGTFVDITLADMIDHCYRFDPNTGDVYTRFINNFPADMFAPGCEAEDYDPFIPHDGSPPPRVIGQLRNTEDHMDMPPGRILAMGRAAAAEGNTLFEASEIQAINAAAEAIARMDAVRDTPLAREFIVKHLADLGLNESDTRLLNAMGGVPPGYQSLEGLEAIANASPHSGIYSGLRANATAFVHEFPKIVAKMRRLLPESPLWENIVNDDPETLQRRVFRILMTPRRVNYFYHVRRQADHTVVPRDGTQDVIVQALAAFDKARGLGWGDDIAPQPANFNEDLASRNMEAARSVYAWATYIRIAISLIGNVPKDGASRQRIADQAEGVATAAARLLGHDEGNLRGGVVPGFLLAIAESVYRLRNYVTTTVAAANVLDPAVIATLSRIDHLDARPWMSRLIEGLVCSNVAVGAHDGVQRIATTGRTILRYIAGAGAARSVATTAITRALIEAAPPGAAIDALARKFDELAITAANGPDMDALGDLLKLVIQYDLNPDPAAFGDLRNAINNWNAAAAPAAAAANLPDDLLETLSELENAGPYIENLRNAVYAGMVDAPGQIVDRINPAGGGPPVNPVLLFIPLDVLDDAQLRQFQGVLERLQQAYQNAIRGDDNAFTSFVATCVQNDNITDNDAIVLNGIIDETLNAVAMIRRENAARRAGDEGIYVMRSLLMVSKRLFVRFHVHDTYVVPGDPVVLGHAPEVARDIDPNNDDDNNNAIAQLSRYYRVGVPFNGIDGLEFDREVGRAAAAQRRAVDVQQIEPDDWNPFDADQNFRRALRYIAEGGSPAERMFAHFFMHTPINSHALKRLAEHNIPIPFAFVVVRPHQRHLASMVMFCKAGESMGNMMLRPAIVELGDDPQHEVHTVRVDAYFRALVHSPEHIFIWPYAASTRVLNGNGTKWFEPGRYDPSAGLYGSSTNERDGSLMCFIIPADYAIPSPFPIAGVSAAFNVALSAQPTYPTAVWYARFWGFQNSQMVFQNQVNGHNYMDIFDLSPYYSWNGFTLLCGPSGEFDRKREEQGPRKQGTTYPGCRRLWDGEVMEPDAQQARQFAMMPEQPYPQRKLT